RDDLLLLGAPEDVVVVPGELHLRVVRVRPAVAEEDLRHRSRVQIDHALRDLGGEGGRHRRKTGVVAQAERLLAQGAGGLGPAVADVAAPEAAHGVEVGAAAGVPQRRALAGDDHRRGELGWSSSFVNGWKTNLRSRASAVSAETSSLESDSPGIGRSNLLGAHCGRPRGLRTFAHNRAHVHADTTAGREAGAGMTRIRRVDVYAVTFRHAAGPFTMSGGRVSTEQDSTVVRLETDDGLTGYGESCVISPDYAPGYAGSTRAILRLLAPAVVGEDPRQVELVAARMDAVTKGYAYAKSAIDIACWDLFGRATGLRVSDLLGGTQQEDFP